MKSIKIKGMIFSLSLILIAVSALGISAYYRSRKILVNEINEAVLRVAEESAGHLSNYISNFISPLEGLAENSAIKSMEWKRQREVIMDQIYPQYLNIAVLDTEGKARYVDDTIIDLSDRDYIKSTLSGTITFSEILISRKTGKPAILVGVPIQSGNKIVGALIARLEVGFMSDQAFTRGYGENGLSYIISEAGTFIAKPKQQDGKDIYNLSELATDNELYQSFNKFVHTSQDYQSGYGKYDFGKESILMGYASITGTTWKVFIGTQEKDALESLKSLETMMFLISFAAVVLSTIAAWIYINSFAKRITELDQLFSQGARGNLTVRYSFKSKDEIGRVGISFNRMMDKIKTLTHYDPLTSLLNQFVLEKDVEALIQNDITQEFNLIMIAIDKFSLINDTYGYVEGDYILKEVGKRICSSVAEDSKVYRYKGDEFVILINDQLSKNEVEVAALNTFTLLKESYQNKDKSIDINISMGIFTWNDSSKKEDPIKAVTQAKNYAKYLGSNQIQYFDQQIYHNIIKMQELQSDIVGGLKKGEFFLVYQPMFYLSNESIAEIEALIRWKHPVRGLLYPDQFIDLAEQSGTIINIDYWVLEMACKQLRYWKDKNKKLVRLSVNVSAKTFETNKFITDLVDMINFYGIEPTYLQLEITERMVIRNVEDSINKLIELRRMGIHIAIDDFGIGYSSLSYIVRLPIDSIKIDKSFVQNISTSNEAKSIVATIINLCKTLQLNVIGEGVESTLELNYLKNNACDIGQGYYFSKPISMEEIENKYLCIKKEA
jgi:diguanylate cyclase (GGDEF)-like protein